MPEERDLLDIGRDRPCARGPGGEEYDVAWAEPTFFALPIGNEGLAGDDDRSLVLVVMPVEASGCALPDHAVRGAVIASRQFLAPRLWRSVQNPIWGDRGGSKVSGGSGIDHDRFGHDILRMISVNTWTQHVTSAGYFGAQWCTFDAASGRARCGAKPTHSSEGWCAGFRPPRSVLVLDCQNVSGVRP